jgi:PAS domain S-box-containing protein
MTFTVAAVLGGLAILAAAIVGLLVQRRRLRESLEQFRLTANQAPVLIWTARPDTSLDYLNGFCEQLTGRPLEQLRENGWLDFVHPEDVQRCFDTYMPAFEARKPFLLEYRLRHADGDYQRRPDIRRAAVIRAIDPGLKVKRHPGNRSSRRYSFGRCALLAHKNASVRR